MGTADLYEQDFYAWVERNAALIQEGRMTELDFEHIAAPILPPHSEVG